MSDSERRPALLSGVRSVVVKIGTNALTAESGAIDEGLVEALCADIAALISRGLRVTVVSSGAIGAGMNILGLATRPDELPRLQACAAVGQSRLIEIFEAHLNRHGLHAAQILITRDDLERRTRYLNIRNCINALHELGSVPILNENDTVSVDEIRYGDNDIIAALVTNNLRANLLILLTVTEGLCRDGGKGGLIDIVEHIDDGVRGQADSSRSARGSGGMRSKLEAVEMVTQSGEPAVIACGSRPHVLQDILAGKAVGTLFLPSATKMTSRKRWLAFTARSRGRLTVDAGAARALTEGGKSLLASGITDISGKFDVGDVVSIIDLGGRELGRGLTNFDSPTLESIRGMKSADFKRVIGKTSYSEVIHRDNMALRTGVGEAKESR